MAMLKMFSHLLIGVPIMVCFLSIASPSQILEGKWYPDTNVEYFHVFCWYACLLVIFSGINNIMRSLGLGVHLDDAED